MPPQLRLSAPRSPLSSAGARASALRRHTAALRKPNVDAPLAAPKHPQPRFLANVWQETLNPQGRMYYANAKTLEKRWDLPLGAKLKRLVPAAPKQEQLSLVWRLVDKAHFSLVQSQTLYWAAFAASAGGLVAYYYAGK